MYHTIPKKPYDIQIQSTAPIPKKYNTKQKITHPILIPKYNTPYNRMIHKYKICPPYPKNTLHNKQLLIYKLLTTPTYKTKT